MRILPLLAFLAVSSGALAERATTGLQALYTFQDKAGPLVKDRSGLKPALDLKIDQPQNVRRTEGALEIRKGTLLRSTIPAARLNKAIKRSGEITIEAWIKPANTKQSGPARVVTISQHSTQRNATLGQDGDKFDIRLRTSRRNENGLPSLSTRGGSVSTGLAHLVYSRQRSGQTIIYLNGKPLAKGTVEGNTSNWNDTFHLALGNEINGSRPWLGTYYLVAVYNRHLTAEEVGRNFQGGAGAESAALIASQPNPKAIHFETRVAPILANHCIECHDPANRKGKLDLSRKETAFAKLKKGHAIVPGDPSKSLLWASVHQDEMPEEGDPLTAQQKADLKKWIADGATWTLKQIDPANYLHGTQKAQQWVQRLTTDEYIATVKATVDVDIAAEARQILPPDLRADGFNNTAYNLTVDLKHVQAYGKLARIIVSRMDTKAFARRFSNRQRFTDNDMAALIKPMGKWILRGPLDDRELIAYRGVSTAVASVSGTFEEAVGYMIEAMLQSPRFIYRIESQRGDGTNWPLDDYELASRLSYIIWGSSPDLELTRAADRGELSDPAALESQVDRMLKDARAIERSLQFASQWLNLGRLSNMQPDPKKFPNWEPQLASDMRKETLAFFREIAWSDKPLSSLLNSQFTYLTPRLAAHYRGEYRRGTGRGDQELVRTNLTEDSTRGGLLSHGSVLTVGGDSASMVTRGLFVMHNLLRGVVKDPPPGVDTTPVPARPGLSHRGAAEDRIADRNCGGCHEKFEPLAFGLETYDGLGSFHLKDSHGNQLRQDGDVLIPGEAKAKGYQSTGELMNILARTERVGQSLTWKITQFSLGRPLGIHDALHVEEIHTAARKAGGNYPAVIKSLVLSDLVRMTRTEAE